MVRSKPSETNSLRPTTFEEARKIQEELSRKVRLSPLTKTIQTIAGIDVAFTDSHSIAVVALFDYQTRTLIEHSQGILKTAFPYVPGYLTFREGLAIHTAVKALKHRPDVLLFDGQGIAHPRGFGLASHMGVILGAPSIGCAKSRLIGDYAEPGEEKGSWSPLYRDGKAVGAVLRTRTSVKPLFVSPGHLITLEEAVVVVSYCSVSYRIPEPLRVADSLSRKLKGHLIG